MRGSTPLLAAALLAAFPAVAGVGEGTGTASGGGACADPLAVGHTDWPPFDIPAEDGLTGINGDILSAVAKRMGCRVTWHKRPWKRVLKELRTGELDVTGGAHRTDRRAAYARFSIRYLPYEAVLFVDAEDSNRYTSLRGFLETGQSLGVMRGYTYGSQTDALLDAKAYRPQIFHMYAADENVRALARDRVAGVLGNAHVLNYLAHKHGVSDAIRRTDAVVQSQPVHFMFSRASVAKPVVARFNEALRALKREGRIRDIVNAHTHPGGPDEASK